MKTHVLKILVGVTLVAAPVWAARRASEPELRSLRSLCKQQQIHEVIGDQVYLLEVENPSLKGSFLVPTRNVWLTPPTLELQLLTPSKVLVGLPSPLWNEEKKYRFEKLLGVAFSDANRDGFTDVAIEAQLADPGRHTRSVFRMLLNDRESGFRLEESSGLGAGYTGTLDGFVRAVADYYPAEPRADSLRKP